MSLSNSAQVGSRRRRSAPVARRSRSDRVAAVSCGAVPAGLPHSGSAQVRRDAAPTWPSKVAGVSRAASASDADPLGLLPAPLGLWVVTGLHSGPDWTPITPNRAPYSTPVYTRRTPALAIIVPDAQSHERAMHSLMNRFRATEGFSSGSLPGASETVSYELASGTRPVW